MDSAALQPGLGNFPASTADCNPTAATLQDNLIVYYRTHDWAGWQENAQNNKGEMVPILYFVYMFHFVPDHVQ